VSGLEQQWFETPAAAEVITAEDIDRSGLRVLPEAFRLAPGLNVARINASQWAISSRGFNSRFANKLQVALDGREIYNPLFSGVFWSTQDRVLADVDRIEVIRGPGATLWGSNAVNGVISVRTKSAKDTQGLYVNSGLGTLEEGFGSVRYGDQIGESTYMRVWGKYKNYDNFKNADGGDRPDDWDISQSGFRLDHEGPDDTHLTFQGDAYHSDRIGEGIREPLPPTPSSGRTVFTDGRAIGGNVMLTAEQGSDDSEEGWTFHTYYDGGERVAANGFEYQRHIFNVDFRHHFQLSDRHNIMWGAGYRHYRDNTRSNAFLSFQPADRSLDSFTAFVQDTITLVPDRFEAIVGSKFEHNEYTGFEIQPSARLAWTPNKRNTVWLAASRPVRTPSRAERDLSLTTAFAGTTALQIQGGDADSEKVKTYELGYRTRVTDDLTLDLTSFYTDYDDLIARQPTGIGRFANRNDATSFGGEASATWDVAENWRLRGSYSLLQVDMDGSGLKDDEESAPTHQFQLHSKLDITSDLHFNSALYYVDEVAAHDIPAYTRLDLGLTWQVNQDLEVAAWGQNLLDPQHPEFDDNLFQDRQSEVPRSVFLEMTYRF